MYNELQRTSNKTYSVYLNESFENLFVSDFKLELSALESLNIYSETCMVSAVIGSIVVGSYFKSALYFYLYDTRKEIENRPINILLLLQAIFQHLICLLMAFTYVLGLFFNLTYANILGEAWCNIPWYSSAFGLMYRTFGSLGLAAFRLILIKCSTWVRDKCGQDKLLSVITALGLISSVLLTVAFSMDNGQASRKQIVWNFCIGRSFEFREILHQHSLLTGTSFPQFQYLAKSVILVSLAGVMIELVCYLIFFAHLYSHDRAMITRNILPKHEVNKRFQKNATTFFGQFYGFIIECVMLLGILSTLEDGSDVTVRLLFVVGFNIEFGLISVVEVLTSRCLVQYLPHKRFL